MTEAPRAIAEGALEQTPLAHVLLSILRRELSGTLVIWPEASVPGQDRVRFDRGRIVAARLLTPASALDRGLLPLFHRRSPYAFYEADLVGGGDGVLSGSLDPLGLIVAALRGGARQDVLDQVLAQLGDQGLRLRLGADLSAFGFLPKEQAVVDLMRAAPATASGIVAQSGDPKVARRVVYALTIAKCLEAHAATALGAAAPPRPESTRPPPRPSLGAAPPAPAPTPPASPAPAARAAEPARSPQPPRLPGTPEPAPPPPAGLGPEASARWRELAAFADAIDEMTYFQMLEVEDNPTEQEVRDAYFAKVKKLHPDRLPPELLPLKPWADRVFHHLTEARDQLSNETTRLAHLKAVRAGGGTPASDRKLGAIVSAAMEYQKVEILVRRKEWDEALRILDLNIALSPDEADYHAMKGFVLFQQHGAEGAHHATMMAALDRALALYPMHGRAHFTKASVLKLEGKLPQAIEHFRKVLELSPKHLEASREVRLYEMRHGKRPSSRPPPKPGGESLLDKLKGLGKKK